MDAAQQTQRTTLGTRPELVSTISLAVLRASPALVFPILPCAPSEFSTTIPSELSIEITLNLRRFIRSNHTTRHGSAIDLHL